jgi:hypothetical protein
MSEDIFVKDTKKPSKRQLSDKQKEGLAKGRAKMAEKRKLKKAMEEKRKQLQKKEENIILETAEVHKKQRKKKKEQVADSIEKELTYKQKKDLEDASQTKFSKLKMEALNHINSSDDLNEFEIIMNGVSKEMARNPSLLYGYLQAHGDRLSQKGKK